jgi:hypothetical protein
MTMNLKLRKTCQDQHFSAAEDPHFGVVRLSLPWRRARRAKI